MSTDHADVVALEKSFWTEGHDPKFFKEFFADDGLTVFEPMGFIRKDAALEMLGQAKPWTDVTMEDVQVIELTPECVAIAYHGQGRQEGREEPYKGSISSVYVRRGGHWQLALTVHQPWTPKGEESQAPKQ